MFLGIPIRIKNPDADVKKEFEDYIHTFNKTYLPDSEEYTHRFDNFKVRIIFHDILIIFTLNKFLLRTKIPRFSSKM